LPVPNTTMKPPEVGSENSRGITVTGRSPATAGLKNSSTFQSSGLAPVRS
jgi:hypothetical protein